MELTTFLLAAALHVCGASVQPAAPAGERRFYAYAAGYGAYHPANGPLYHRVRPALGGTTFDVAFGGGGYISERFGLEGEVVIGGDLSAPQHFSYFTSEDYIEHNREILLNELLRFRPAAASRLQLVGGGGFARTTTRETSIVVTDQFGRRTPPDRIALAEQGFTWTAGADVIAMSGAHVMLAPSVRLRWVRQSRPDYANGVGAFTWQFGASVVFR